MLNHGSPFHKVGGVVALPDECVTTNEKLRVAFGYMSVQPCDLIARAFVGRKEITIGSLPPSPGEWVRHVSSPISLSESQSASAATVELNTSGVFGTGKIVVTSVAFLDANGSETFILTHGKPVLLRIAFRITDTALNENAQVVVAFHRDGGVDVCRFITRSLRFDHAERPVGEIVFTLPRLMLANGRYSLTIMLAAAGYYDQIQTVFFSLNPGVYCCMSKLFDVEVVGGDLISSGTMFVGEADWAIR